MHFVADFLLVNVLAWAVCRCRHVHGYRLRADNKLAPFWNEGKAIEQERGH